MTAPDSADLDSAIREKSQLLIDADVQEKTGDARASDTFRRAARMEERIAEELRAAGEPGWSTNALSAASCFAKAGEYGLAGRWFARLLEETPQAVSGEELAWFLSLPAVAGALESASRRGEAAEPASSVS